MTNSVVYDRANYHLEGDWPARLAAKQAYVHAGLFLGWVIERELYSDEFAEDFADEIRDFRARKRTGPEIYRRCGGALVDDMLTKEGNAFASNYFDLSTGKYLLDYARPSRGGACDFVPRQRHMEESRCPARTHRRAIRVLAKTQEPREASSDKGDHETPTRCDLTPRVHPTPTAALLLYKFQALLARSARAKLER
jgi:hypothetical protein